jgi:hypothetical protein
MLGIVQIQICEVPPDDLIHAREHNVINRRKAFQDFNESLLFTGVANLA